MTPTTSRSADAEAQVLRLLRSFADHPSPRGGGVTAFQIMEIQQALAAYLSAQFLQQFSLAEYDEMARDVIVEHQARHHAENTAPDVRAQGDHSGRWLLEMALNRVLDSMKGRPLALGLRGDDELVQSIFGEDASAAEVVEALCNLRQKGDKTTFRVVVCYLTLAEHQAVQQPAAGVARRDLPRDQDVVAMAGIPGLCSADVKKAILRFAFAAQRLARG